MESLLVFVKQYKNLLTFLLLELISFILLVNTYRPYNTYFESSFGDFTNYIATFSSNLSRYFSLKDVNAELLQENAYLNYLLVKEKQTQRALLDPLKDTLIVNQYNYMPAKVVNNTTHKSNNYITINKGLSDGVLPGMGVVSSTGLVGRVMNCSNNFSVVISILHSETLYSVELKRNHIIGSLRWEGKDPTTAKVLHIPSHFDVKQGDTLVTSGYNSVFPSGVFVGIVKTVNVKHDETFYDVGLHLGADFNKLSYVYVVKNSLKEEQITLESDTLKRNIPTKYISDKKQEEIEKKRKEEEERRQRELEEKWRKEQEAKQKQDSIQNNE